MPSGSDHLLFMAICHQDGAVRWLWTNRPNGSEAPITTLSDLVDGADVDAVRAALEGLGPGGSATMEHGCPLDGGGRVRSSFEAVDLDGTPSVMVMAERVGVGVLERQRELVTGARKPVVVHVDGVVVAASQRALDLVGADATEQVVGHSLLDFVAPDSVPAVLRRRFDRDEHGEWSEDETVHLLRLDGATIEVWISSVPVPWGDQLGRQLSVVPVETASASGESARRELCDDLARGIAAGELEVHYQPIVEARTSGLQKVEALVRWRHPRRGLLLPADFLVEVESSPEMDLLTDEVLRLAIDQTALWRRQLDIGLEVSVNLSASQLERLDLVERIGATLAGAGVPPSALWIEVTETMLEEDPLVALEQILRLRQAGIRISVDDFGTGFAGLERLRRYPVDALKIDRLFVAGVTDSIGDEVLVRAMASLGHELGIEVVAEGVETDEQRALLVSLRCDSLQGFWFGRPVPPTPTPPWLHEVAEPAVDDVEQRRLAALDAVRILDTPPEAVFDDAVALIAELCHVPVAMVTMIDVDRQWSKAAFGTPLGQSPREHSFCDVAIETGEVLVVPDVTVDDRFRDNPFVRARGGVRSYAGVPLVLSDGSAVGTLCAIDDRPHDFTDGEIRSLERVASQVREILDLRRVANLRERKMIGAAGAHRRNPVRAGRATRPWRGAGWVR